MSNNRKSRTRWLSKQNSTIGDCMFQEICSSFSNYSKKLKRKEYSQTMKPSLPWYQNWIKTPQKKKKKRKVQATIFDEYRHKNSQQNISRLNSTIHNKDHTEWSSRIYSRGAEIVQYLQISQHIHHVNKIV